MIADVASPTAPVSAETTGALVYEMFEAAPDTMAIAVVDPSDAPIGLIERSQFMLKFGSMHGRNLFAGRSVTLVMDADPITVDRLTPISAFTDGALSQSPADLLKGFIVVADGRYLGVGSVLSLLQAAHAESLRQAALLRDSIDAAESANRAKSSFLAMMSHEIRTPLNGVLGMAQAMAMDPLSKTQRARLDVVRQSGEGLLAILNDILDLSKIEAGRFTLESIDFDLGEIMQGARSAFMALANEKGLDFRLDLSGAEGVYRGDPTRVRQILHNLISNALKFTEAGEIRVWAEPIEHGLRLAVSDTGVGIDPDKLASLFTKFTQADASTTRRYGGTGLGLSICRELAEMMGGDIEAHSALGQGATFIVTIQIDKVRERVAITAAPSDEAPDSAEDLDALKVLVAEDNVVNQLVIKTLLNQVGIAPAVVANGAMAVEAWKTGDWDVVLMDVQMPVMDGIEAARAIRARERQAGRTRTPIVALTANAMAHQVAEYVAAGMDGHLAKPIEIRALFEMLAGLPAHGPDADGEHDERRSSAA
jgi:signal transduction histidine kinase/FixJ family two-component response regulator